MSVFLVPEVGLEPTTFRVWTECSSQLSYSGKYITSTQPHRLFLSGPIYLSRPSSSIPSMWFNWSLLADSNRSLNSHNVACFHYTKAGIFKTLYILCKMWDSNPRPKVFKTFARPTELTSRWIVNCCKCLMEQITGFEPVPSPWQGEILPLYYICIWWVYKPAASLPHIHHLLSYLLFDFSCMRTNL